MGKQFSIDINDVKHYFEYEQSYVKDGGIVFVNSTGDIVGRHDLKNGRFELRRYFDSSVPVRVEL